MLDEIPLVNSAQLDAGTLLCSITYDKVSHFEGEYVSGIQKPNQLIGKKVGLFKGKVPSKNLFSCIDPAVIDQNFKFIESHYEDEELHYA